MATPGRDGSPFDGGVGGKFRRKPFRRPQTTPYDRPPTALRIPSTSANNNNNGWLSRLVDPASKLITASAHKLFASVLRKRLPPPPQPPQPVSEAKKDSEDKVYQAISTTNRPMENPPGVQQGSIKEGDNPNNNSNSNEFMDLVKILEQKTFTRSEIDRLTSLLHSSTFAMPASDEEKPSEANPLRPVAAYGREEEPRKSPMQEDGIQSHQLHGVNSNSIFSSRVLEEDVASPAELAKAYMGSRASKVSPSGLGLHSRGLREESPLLSNVPFPPKSPVMSLVPKSSVHVGVPENGYVTPGSRGRSAIYRMVRTPYSRIHPAASQKGFIAKFDAYSGPSTSSFQSGLEGSRVPSKQVALKRRSSVLDNDIGSVSPIRRIRQKLNLAPRISTFPVTQSPLSGTGVVSNSQTQNDDILPGTSFPPVPSQSREMAQKILQQLDKLVPSKNKSSELKLAITREASPAMLTPDMLHGKARRSLEQVDSAKFFEIQNNMLVDTPKTSLPDSRESIVQKQDKVKENGPTKVVDPMDRLPHAVNGAEAAALIMQSAPVAKFPDSAVASSAAHPPMSNKGAFKMSVPENFFDLDDDGYTNGTTSTPLDEESKDMGTTLAGGKTIFGETSKMEKRSVSSEVKPPASSTLNESTNLEISNGSAPAEKSTGFNFLVAPAEESTGFGFLVAPASGMTTQPSVPYPGSNSTIDKVGQSKEPSTAPPIFSFSSNNVDEGPLFSLPSSSVISESTGIKSGVSSDPTPGSSISVDVAAGAVDATQTVPESDRVDKSTLKGGDIFRKPEKVLPSAASTSGSSVSPFTFGFPANNSSSTIGSTALVLPSFSSSAPVFSFNGPNSFKSSTVFPFTSTDTATTSTATGTTSTTTGTSDTNGTVGNLSTSSLPSFSAATTFNFGSSVSPLTSVSPVSSGVELTDTQVKNKQETIFGNLSSTPFATSSSAIASTGSGIFGFSASDISSTVTKQSQGSTSLGTSSGSLADTVQVGSSASAPTFGLSGTTAFASGSSLFGDSASATILFNSGASFGLGSSASSSEANSISSHSGTASSLFGSSWQPGQTSIFGSTVNSTAPSTGFPFGGSSASVAMNFGSSTSASTGSTFSFTSAAANTSSTSLTPLQPLFGGTTSAFPFGSSSVGGDQMNMEDTMAEDTMQASTPSVPNFVQPPISSPSTGFMFSSAAPSGANPFQFGSQQNSAALQSPSLTPLGANPFQFGSQQNSVAPQNSTPFQASGSLDFNAGGSFSLGSGGGDKSSRRIVRVKHKQRKK